MKKLKLWYRNLKWLFNSPPIAMTMTPPEYQRLCDYCGSEAHWVIANTLNFCFPCMKQVFDKALKKPELRSK